MNRYNKPVLLLSISFICAMLACGEQAASHSDGDGMVLSADGETGSDQLPAPELNVLGGEGGEHGDRDGGEHGERTGDGEHEGEHADGDHSEGGEHGGRDEESGEYIGRADVWDAVRRGAWLALTYDEATAAFVGTVRNTTNERMCDVRVEVHLSSGTELGPTARTDLAAGQTVSIILPATGAGFDSWTAHPEMSRCSN